MKFRPQDRRPLLKAARGLIPSELAIENARLLNVFTGEIYPATVYIHEGFIAYVDPTPKADPALAEQVVDAGNRYLIPGFVDPHIHIESTMTTPRAVAPALVVRGTTTVVTDPHEIANVLGEEGVRYMHDAAEGLPMRQLIDIPSCIPSVPGLENAATTFDADTIHRLAALPRVVGLAEVMDFLSVADGEQRMLDIIEAAEEAGLVIQGHVPSGDARLLAAYRAAGPISCHETRMGADAVEKIRAGMIVDARESSMAQNVGEIVEATAGFRWLDRLSLCTDDREVHDILTIGHMDNAVARAVAAGMNPADAIRSATLLPAIESGRENVGAIAPGYVADLLLLDDLTTFTPHAVYFEGQLVAKEGRLLVDIPELPFETETKDTMRVPELTRDDFLLRAPATEGTVRCNVLRFTDLARPVSDRDVEQIPVKEGLLDLSGDEGLCFVKIINRHGAGTVCDGVVRDFGLKAGAYASTVSHDCHNLCVVYRDPDSALRVYEELRRCGGGLCLHTPEDGVTLLPLPVAGLMTTRAPEETAEDCIRMKEALKRAGMPQENPMVRIFTMALPVIPKAKYSDLGLIDVLTKEIYPLFAQ
ncbi:MAG: adenine deaminase [Clostridia bacterium]|nr:adenine deaminase [Clostridia bacterium]